MAFMVRRGATSGNRGNTYPEASWVGINHVEVRKTQLRFGAIPRGRGVPRGRVRRRAAEVGIQDACNLAWRSSLTAGGIMTACFFAPGALTYGWR